MSIRLQFIDVGASLKFICCFVVVDADDYDGDEDDDDMGDDDDVGDDVDDEDGVACR